MNDALLITFEVVDMKQLESLRAIELPFLLLVVSRACNPLHIQMCTRKTVL